MKDILRIDNLYKAYCPNTLKAKFNAPYKAMMSIRAVNDVSFSVREGEIYGLLGPNGAGKSTIIKVITGLIKKDEGKVIVAGHDIDSERQEASSMIGAIIETPTMFRSMSARDNLRYFGCLEGNVTEDKINAALDTVGLIDRANDKISTYSMGMLQRLGIAQAIMSSPKLLVLDEPTNGLDPEWIINIRELITRLAKEYNIAVLVCSHILAEMQALCDRVGIIYNGKLIKEIEVSELDNMKMDGNSLVCYTTTNPERTQALIKAKYDKAIIKKDKVYVELVEKEIPVLTKYLVEEGVEIYGIAVKKMSLEDVFKSLIDKSKHTSDNNGGDADVSKML